jgi:zinc transport system ATP-binding protein
MLTGMSPPVVALRSGSAGYDGRPALVEVDLQVAAGELLAVLGANGSGKSTLVRCLLGLTPLTAGSLELFGVPLPGFRQWARIGYVPQRVGATSGVPATVGEVVASGRLARMRRFARRSAADRAAVADALATVNLADREGDNVASLSGGQQQRVLIARALAGEPELLVLDEPTAGVDADNQHALADALGVLVSRRVTVVLVAHELGPVAPLVERAVVLAHGRVLHDGPPPTDDHVHLHDPEHAHPAHAVVPPHFWNLS